MRGLRPRAQVLAIFFAVTTVLLAGGLAGSWAYIYRLKTAQGPEPPPPPIIKVGAGPVSPLLVRYQLDLPGRGEVFPALAGAREDLPMAVLTISNTSDRPLLQAITAGISGWTEPAHKTVVVGARETRSVHLSPELLPRAYQNQEIRRATLKVNVSSPDTSGTLFSQSRRVYLHGAYDLYWGKKFSNAQYVARWVTPHDSAVLKLVSQARKFVPRGRMPGYDRTRKTPDALAREVRLQARAVFQALEQSGLSYVNSVFTFGNLVNEAQRIRSPRETLTLSSANCIDVSVAFSAAMENLGLDPVILIVPGHAFTGVRLGPGSNNVLYLDLTVLPNGSFESAIARAQGWLKKTPANQLLTVDVAAARAMGIYPMPDEAPAPSGGVPAEAAQVRQE